MASSDYSFVTRWRVCASIDEIAAVFADVCDLARWWPSVYLDVRELAPGDAGGVGKLVDLYTRGWLPYTLRWRFRVEEVVYGERIVIAAQGDFVGRGVWTFRSDGAWTELAYDWRIRAEKPLLRRWSFLLKPIFAANHEWAMRQGLRSLELELARRRAATPQELAAIPAPPGPVSALAPTLALAALLAGGALAAALARSLLGR